MQPGLADSEPAASGTEICAKGSANDTTHGHCARMLTIQHKIRVRIDRNIGHNTAVNTNVYD